jgi:hypothetical protein
MANEGHEPARFQGARLERISVSFNVEQFLILRIAHRQNQPATLGKLRAKRFRHRWRRCGNEYRVKRGKFLQPQRAVATVNMNSPVSEPLKPGRGRGSKF